MVYSSNKGPLELGVDRVRQRIERAMSRDNLPNIKSYIARELDKTISEFFPLYSLDGSRLNTLIESLYHILFGRPAIEAKVEQSNQTIKTLIMESAVNMIKFDTEVTLMTVGMCITFLKKRLLAFCQRIFASEFAAKLVYTYFEHNLVFEIEHLKVSELMLEMNPEGEIGHNYVNLDNAQHRTFLEEVRAVPSHQDRASLQDSRPLSSAYRIGSISESTAPPS